MEIKSCESGFTFVEAIFVLSVVSLISLVAFNLFPKYEEKKAEQFLEQFERDVAFMQQSAITNSSRHKLYFIFENHSYIITNGVETILVRQYSPDVNVQLSTLSNPITYGADGNISKGGTMYVLYQTKKYNVVFQLGKGRFTFYLS